MAVASILPPGKTQFFDANGNPLASGFVYFYIPNTTTFKNTWKDPSQSVLNANPVPLDGSGEAIIYGSGQYRQIVMDSGLNTIWDQLTADISYSAGQAGYLLNSNNLSDVSSASTSRTNLGLGTAATQNTGTSGANVPLLNGSNSWSATQTTAGITDSVGITSINLNAVSSSAAYTGVSINNTASGGRSFLIAASPTGGLAAAGTLVFYDATAGSNQIRGGFDSTGKFNLVIGATSISPASTTTSGVSLDALANTGISAAASAFSALNLQRTTSDGQIAAFWRQTTQVGNISVTAAATAYNTSSDMRLKENAQSIDSGAILDAIKPYKFQWKVDGSTAYGVYAQEAYEVFPEAITPGDEGGEITEAWSVDYSKFVPLLLAEVKSLRARISILEQGV